MTPLDFVISLGLISVAAGMLGSLVGLGGGVVIVPVLTLLFHVDIRLAIGASLVSVIATSSGAAAAYVREKMTNLRAGMFLEVATTTGAITGAYLTTLQVEFDNLSQVPSLEDNYLIPACKRAICSVMLSNTSFASDWQLSYGPSGNF